MAKFCRPIGPVFYCLLIKPPSKLPDVTSWPTVFREVDTKQNRNLYQIKKKRSRLNFKWAKDNRPWHKLTGLRPVELKIARSKQFLLFPQCFLLNQIIVSPFVHIFDIISLFAAELENPKFGLWGKGLTSSLFENRLSPWRCKKLTCSKKFQLRSTCSCRPGYYIWNLVHLTPQNN